VQELIAETRPLIDLDEEFSNFHVGHQRVGLICKGFCGLRSILTQRGDAQIPVRERDIGQRVAPCLAGNRCHLLFEHLSPLSHVRGKLRVDGKRQRFLLHRFKGRGGNQVRLEIPVLATACHPDIATAEAIAQFRESAQFVECRSSPSVVNT
jgi:hypothetical protein